MAVARHKRQRAIEVGSMTDLLTALRVRKDELGLNMTKVDALASFQFGYTGKLFSRKDSRAHRAMTDFALAGLLGALECKLILVPADDEADQERAKLRVAELKSAMRAPSTHVAQPADIEIQKVADALENEKIASAEQARHAAKKRWARYGKKTRREIMKDVAARRWADGATERRKAKRSAAASKAARVRWKKERAAKGRERVAIRPSSELPHRKEPGQKASGEQLAFQLPIA